MRDYYVTASWMEEGAGICTYAGSAETFAAARELAWNAARKNEWREELSIQIDFRARPLWRIDAEGETHALADLAPHGLPQLRSAA